MKVIKFVITFTQFVVSLSKYAIFELVKELGAMQKICDSLKGGSTKCHINWFEVKLELELCMRNSL